ncbi:MAG: DUF3822 family protein [Bacteroidales bacterium]|nr:DUF3822 family protein [Bacteroidales bacterium]
MKNISEKTQTFNINKTSTYNLSIQISQWGFTYCILDTYSKEYVAVKHVGYGMELSDENLYDKIKQNLTADACMGKSYKSVDMIFVTRKSLMVPNQIFDKTKLKDLVRANFEISDKEEIQFNKLKSISACNVFVIPSFITTLMVNTFPEINFYHEATPFIENLIKNGGEDTTVSVNFYYDFMDIAVTEKGKVLLYNTFAYKNATDVLYCVSSVMSKLKLGKKTAVKLSGYHDKDSDIFKLLYDYLPNVSFTALSKDLKYPFSESLPDHTFFNMMTLPCVL